MADRFDASGDKLTANTNLLSSSRGATMCGLFRIAVDRNDWSTVMSLSSGNPASGNKYIYIQTDTTGTDFHLYVEAAGDSSLFTATVGTWYFMAITSSATGTVKAYYAAVGATSLNVVTSGTTVSSWTPDLMAFGDSAWTGEWLNGNCAGLKAWSAELTQAELEAEMFFLLAQRAANLNRSVPCFAGSGERARDYSGNGYHLTEGGTLTDENDPPVLWTITTTPVYVPVSGTNTYALSAALDGTSALTGVGKNTFTPAAALDATSTLTGVGKNTFTPAAALDATSTLTGVGKNTFTPTSTLAGTSALTGVGKNTFTPAAALDATSALTGVGKNTFTPAAVLNGTSVLTADITISGTNTYSLVSTLAGSSVLTGVGKNTFTPTADLAGSSLLTAAGKNTFSPADVLAGASLLTVVGKNTFALSNVFLGTSQLTVSILDHAIYNLESTLAGESTLNAALVNEFLLAASMAGESQMSASLSMREPLGPFLREWMRERRRMIKNK